MILKVQTRSKYTSGSESLPDSLVNPSQLRAGLTVKWPRASASPLWGFLSFVIPAGYPEDSSKALENEAIVYISVLSVLNTTANSPDPLSPGSSLCVDTY